MTYTKRFLLSGVAFGTLFPIVATMLESWLSYQSLAFSSLMDAQKNQPLLLIIDTAPFFLGMFAYYAGVQYDRVQSTSAERKKLLKKLESKNIELEKKVLERTAELQSNMEKAQVANQAKSQFLAAISHELRTPLTSINGSLKLLLGGAIEGDSEKERELLNIASNNCNRLTNIVDDLIDVAVLESNSVAIDSSVQDLIPLLQQIVEQSQPFADKHKISLDLQLPRETLQIHVDKTRLLQVLNSLISNAVQYSPNNSVIEVSAALIEDKVKIAVKDHGEGIAPEMQDTIFEKFTQLDQGNTRKTGRLGVGLHIAKQLVNVMHGSIHCDSKPGNGSTFYVLLPREPMNQESLESA